MEASNFGYIACETVKGLAGLVAHNDLFILSYPWYQMSSARI